MHPAGNLPRLTRQPVALALMKPVHGSSLGKATQKQNGPHRLFQKLKPAYTAYNKSSKRLR